MVYFRVNVRDDSFHPEPMLEPFLDYNPVLRDKARVMAEGASGSHNNNDTLVRPGYVDDAREHRAALERDKQVREIDLFLPFEKNKSWRM